jgi:hypothetical protein
MGFFTLVSTCLSAYLVHREKVVDRERKASNGRSTEYLDHRTKRTSEAIERSRRRGGP